MLYKLKVNFLFEFVFLETENISIRNKWILFIEQFFQCIYFSVKN